MKSNDWRHKNVARYTPGNTKILYFFNCLLDGMHTNLSSRGRLLCLRQIPILLDKGYRLHTISTTSGGSKGLGGGDRIQATMVFERIE